MSAPLLKATKFVGQGTGTTIEDSSTPNTKRTTTTRVAGMNQKEQQQVIRDFRDGKHNILVCTCECIYEILSILSLLIILT
jgi:ERCC4-related helicase